MATEEVARLLAPTSTNAERVQGLLAIGIPVSALAEATRTAVSTLRNWSSGQSEPRPASAIVLDDLRTAVAIMLAEVEPERVARWVTSRDPEAFNGMRPIEYVRVDPMDVLAAAHGKVEEFKLERERREAGQQRARRNGLAIV